MSFEFNRQERERKILFTSAVFAADFGKVYSRFIAEAIVGIAASGSVRLTEIGRVLEEAIPLHATRKRLSRNLANERIESVVGEKVLELGAESIGQDTLLVVNPSGLKKKYAESMEYLGVVRSDGDQTASRGYSLCEIVGWELGSNTITPLAEALWSQNAPEAMSESDQILSLVRRVRQAAEGRGIIVCHQPGDHRDLLVPWTEDPTCRYLVSLCRDCELLYKRRAMRCLELGRLCKFPYADIVHKIYGNGSEHSTSVSFGFLPVRLPEYPDRPLWLVVVKSSGRVVQAILTTEPMRRNRRVLQWAMEATNAGWTAEETMRLLRQRVGFDDIRVLKYRRLKNMAALVLFESFYIVELAPDFRVSESGVRFQSCNGAQSACGVAARGDSPATVERRLSAVSS